MSYNFVHIRTGKTNFQNGEKLIFTDHIAISVIMKSRKRRNLITFHNKNNNSKLVGMEKHVLCIVSKVSKIF